MRACVRLGKPGSATERRRLIEEQGLESSTGMEYVYGIVAEDYYSRWPDSRSALHELYEDACQSSNNAPWACLALQFLIQEQQNANSKEDEAMQKLREKQNHVWQPPQEMPAERPYAQVRTMSRRA